MLSRWANDRSRKVPSIRNVLLIPLMQISKLDYCFECDQRRALQGAADKLTIAVNCSLPVVDDTCQEHNHPQH